MHHLLLHAPKLHLGVIMVTMAAMRITVWQQDAAAAAAAAAAAPSHSSLSCQLRT
jgi:hypothetical protein